ncbi:ADP-ribosylglycohydrolase family protein [Desertivirga arenae]|uniref:ADP-ribosylglycohydrolase family protein n=1 Tax=Desertivirga arenae TaxID=2810309 RepID=UPI001A9754CB|nr:ADP-ribosylglycohydrolase family protein [Pedobacter sp. SYSU D00823]
MKGNAIDLLLGVAIGDALGVPYEFLSREEMVARPAKGMVGYGTHHQPAGTWSDDSSLTFCLAESLHAGYSLNTTAANFIKWRNYAYWTARNEIFDIGVTTNRAITRLAKILNGEDPAELRLLKYEAEEFDNGNGSLMRILPLLFEVKDKGLKEQFEIIWENSALTHRHIRAAMSCMIYLNLAENLLIEQDKNSAYQKTRCDINQLWEEMNFSDAEKTHFARIVQNDIREAKKETILSGGYVIESLEASLWSFLNTESFESAVLTAINFGHDTDTNGAITGGLAGLYYGRKEMPEVWIVSLARMENIIELGEKLEKKYRS